MDPKSIVWAKDGSWAKIKSREKTDFGRGCTEFLIRKLPEDALCPVTHLRLLLKGAIMLACYCALWCTAKGRPYSLPNPLLILLKQLLLEAGVPPMYKPYSIRHAWITALCSFLREQDVNAYTGHSFNAHTVLKANYHQDKHWIGRELAKRNGHSKRMHPIPLAAQQIIDQTDGVEEGEAEDISSDGEEVQGVE
jgi:hypothetical protein